jgi:hypothetical protein
MNRLDEYRKKRRTAIRYKVVVFVILFFLIVAGLSFASSSEKLKISQINISGNRIVENKDIENLVRQDLSGKYLHLFSRANSFIYPAKEVKRDLMQKFKNLLGVSLSVADTKVLEISVKERGEKYIWCDNILPSIDEGSIPNCFFLDSDGYIFDTAPYFSGSVYFKFYGKNPHPSGPIGYYFLPDNFKKVASFKNMMEKMNLKVMALEAKEDGDMYAYLSSGASIIFKSSDDLTKLAENLQSALATEPLHTDFDKKYNSLLYIDLRFGNKVYYKFNNAAK